MPFTREQVKEYLKDCGLRCPYCGSDQIEGDEWNSGAGEAWQEIRCLACDKKWDDLYNLVGIEERG